MADRNKAITEIMSVMESQWDLPADCNEGELFAYAETLYDRVESGETRSTLYAYLEGVQAQRLETSPAGASGSIVDRAIALVRPEGR